MSDNKPENKCLLRALQLRNMGLPYRAIAERLNNEGFRTPTGLELNKSRLHSMLYESKLKERIEFQGQGKVSLSEDADIISRSYSALLKCNISKEARDFFENLLVHQGVDLNELRANC